MTDTPNAADRKIRVCFVAPKAYMMFNPAVGHYSGGAQVELYHLAVELAKDERFDVSFLVADYGQDPVEHREGVTIYRTIDFRKPIRGVWRVWQGMKLADADIYMAETASPGIPVIVRFCRSRGKAFVYRTANPRECSDQYLRSHPVLGRLFRWSLRRAAIVFAQNQGDTAMVEKTYGLTPVIVPNGHPIGPLPTGERDTVLWVGRDDPIKRPGKFLDLAGRVPEQHFTLVCQTRYDDQAYKDMRRRAEGMANVEFVPHVPYKEVDRQFARAKVLANTSDSEGFPNAFLQACKAGAAILSLNANPDGFLDTYDCGACAGGDLDAMAAVLRSWMPDEKWRQMGLRGREYFEKNHDLSKVVEVYKTRFTEVVRQMRTPPGTAAGGSTPLPSGEGGPAKRPREAGTGEG